MATLHALPLRPNLQIPDSLLAGAVSLGQLETMSTAGLIYERAKGLPGPMQTEALHFVDFLLSRLEARVEDAEWAKFSTRQMEKQYCPADAIHDPD